MSDKIISALNPIRWRENLPVIIQSFIAFYLATFCVGIYFTHQGAQWLITSIFLILLYLMVIIICIIRLVKKLSIPALMLAVPIVPLVVLIIVVTMLPLLERL